MAGGAVPPCGGWEEGWDVRYARDRDEDTPDGCACFPLEFAD
jgi:hypothetical protein